MPKGQIVKRKRKRWPAKKYWTEYLRKGEVWLNGDRTINHAFARILIMRTADAYANDKLREQAIDDFAKYLNPTRLDAIEELRDAGIDVFVVGQPRIEGITHDKKFQDESLRRIKRQEDQKSIATHKAVEAHKPTDEQRREYGLSKPRQINEAKKRLLGGLEGANLEVRK
ncbi:MAG: hypothetical protein ACYSUV_20720 [Planctomycetota bacterium]|jgi:hypothetical protein